MTADSQIVGCILGIAVGDALGLPYENLSHHRATKLLGIPDQYRFLFGYGMVSDDTEHTVMVAQALIASGTNANQFLLELANRFRVWLLGFPAGIGMATLRSITRLWLGFKPDQSGVFSAGNSPAMRAPIIGATIKDPTLLCALISASSRITHTDPKAEYGALTIALATQMASQNPNVLGQVFLEQLRVLLPPEATELLSLLENTVNSVSLGKSTLEFAASLGLSSGVTDYVYHCVPIVIHAWLSHQTDFCAGVIAVISCGGDTDSMAAMVGGIIGCAVRQEGIPAEWLEKLSDSAFSVDFLQSLGTQLADYIQSGVVTRAAEIPFYKSIPRNLFFLLIVLYHGFRRLLPPY